MQSIGFVSQFMQDSHINHWNILIFAF